MVYIGSANRNENGEYEGGIPGDQTGEECVVEPWYLHSKGWYVLRPIDPDKGALMAQDMVYLCNNPNIGYSFWDNSNTLYEAAQPYNFDCSMVETPCDTNCSRGLRVCGLYAGYNLPDFYTGNEIEVLTGTGEFYLITNDSICNTDTYLHVGDVLVTRTQGHTAVVVSIDGQPQPPPEPPVGFTRRMKPFLFINAMTHSRRERTRRTWYS